MSSIPGFNPFGNVQLGQGLNPTGGQMGQMAAGQMTGGPGGMMPGVGFGFNPMDPNSPSPPLGQGAGGVGGGANAPNYAAGKLNNEPQLAVNRQPQALRERMEILKSQFLKNESLSMDIAASLLLGDIPSLYRPSEYVPNYQYDRNPYLGCLLYTSPSPRD